MHWVTAVRRPWSFYAKEVLGGTRLQATHGCGSRQRYHRHRSDLLGSDPCRAHAGTLGEAANHHEVIFHRPMLPDRLMPSHAPSTARIGPPYACSRGPSAAASMGTSVPSILAPERVSARQSSVRQQTCGRVASESQTYPAPARCDSAWLQGGQPPVVLERAQVAKKIRIVHVIRSVGVFPADMASTAA